MQKIEKNGVTWLNLASPEANEIIYLKDNFRIGGQVLKELISSVKRPEIEEYPNYLFLVLHFPVFDPQSRQTTPTELDFVITLSTIITVYQEPIPAFESFFIDCMNNSSDQREYFQSAGYLLFSILDKLIDSCLPMLDHVHDNIDAIENKVFEGREKETLSEIAIVKRDIIDFRRTIKPQRSVLEILAEKADRFFNQNFNFIAEEVIGSNSRVWNTLENHMEMIESIEKTNESLLSYQMNNIIKILTILSFVTFPLNLITGFLGMSLFNNVTFMQWPYTYLFVLAANLCIALAMILFFKKKKWL